MGWAGKRRCCGESEVEGCLVHDNGSQESLDGDVVLWDGGGLVHGDDPESPGRDNPPRWSSLEWGVSPP